MSREIKLRIVLQNPVDGVLYAIQKGKGADYQTVQPQHGKGLDLTFEFSIQLKPANGQTPSLSGPYVQGSAGSRFVYINIGSYVGQSGALWSGRMKVPLPEADFTNAISNESALCWTCSVAGSTEDGKPVFATVKPFTGWSERKQSD